MTNDSHATYTYDSNGNRTMTGYTTGTGNQLTGDGTWTYAYDAEGNQVSKTKTATGEKWTYGYDTHNRLTSAVDATSTGTTLALEYFSYDVFGNRIEQDTWTQSSGTTTVTRFTYDGQTLLADLTSANTLQTRYVQGDAPNQIFARISSAGTVAWYLTDRLGSVRDLMDATGAVQDHINYDGFGNVTAESNTSFGDRFKFQGMDFQIVISMYGTWARFYDPSSGRWISQDPLAFGADDPNLYRYAQNNPSNRTDPTGLDFIAVGSRPLEGIGGFAGFRHLSIWVYYNIAKDPAINKEIAGDTYKKCQKMWLDKGARGQSIELFRDKNWRAWAQAWRPLGNDANRRVWVVAPAADMGISYISYNTADADRIVPVFAGKKDDVMKKWADVTKLADSYEFAEHKYLKYDNNELGKNLRNWPKSLYVTEVKFIPVSNNSNTFIKYLVKKLFKGSTLPSGNHPGADPPSANHLNRKGEAYWFFAKQVPFKASLPMTKWPPKP